MYDSVFGAIIDSRFLYSSAPTPLLSQIWCMYRKHVIQVCRGADVVYLLSSLDLGSSPADESALQDFKTGWHCWCWCIHSSTKTSGDHKKTTPLVALVLHRTRRYRMTLDFAFYKCCRLRICTDFRPEYGPVYRVLSSSIYSQAKITRVGLIGTRYCPPPRPAWPFHPGL